MEMGGEILMLVTYVKFMPIKECCINLNALFDLLKAFRFFPDTLYCGAILLEKVVPLYVRRLDAEDQRNMPALSSIFFSLGLPENRVPA